jgi:hypothetical protein
MKTQISDNPTIKRILITRKGAKEINGTFNDALQEQAQTGSFAGKQVSLKDKEEK